MGSPQTLHDFVLNLLTNPDARSAFALDPEGALREAGLVDITVADVQDVVPLVVDYAPVQGLGPFAPVGDDSGLVEIPSSDPAAVIGQLQHVMQQLAGGPQSSGPDVNTAAPGAITAVAPTGPGMVGPGLTGLGLGVDAPDPSTSLDAVSPAGTVPPADVDVGVAATGVDPFVPTVADVTAVPAGGPGGSAAAADASGNPLGVVDFAGDTLAGALGQVSGLVGSLSGPNGLDGVGRALDAGLARTSGTTDPDGVDATSVVGDLTHHVGGTLRGVTSNLMGETGQTGDVNASTSGGLLGITDDLL